MESRKFFHKNLVTRGKDELSITNGTTSWKFYPKMFNLERNHESFLPLKFEAIRYLAIRSNNTIGGVLNWWISVLYGQKLMLAVSMVW